MTTRCLFLLSGVSYFICFVLCWRSWEENPENFFETAYTVPETSQTLSSKIVVTFADRYYQLRITSINTKSAISVTLN